jgi:hypothetical protein
LLGGLFFGLQPVALDETAVLMLQLAQQLIPNGPAAGRGSIAV